MEIFHTAVWAARFPNRFDGNRRRRGDIRDGMHEFPVSRDLVAIVQPPAPLD